MASQPALLVTHPDGTRHVVLATRPNVEFIERHNESCKPEERFKKIDMDYDEAVEFIQKNGTRDTQHSVDPKVGIYKNVIDAKDNEIEMLRAKLAALEGAGSAAGAALPNAAEVIAKINAATTAAEIEKLAAGDPRKTVQDAAEKAKTKILIK